MILRKPHLILLLLLFTTSACVQLASRRDDMARQTRDEVVKQLVPDKRDMIFEPELGFTGSDQVILSGAVENKGYADTLKQALGQLGFQVLDSLTYLPLSQFKDQKALVRLSVANVKANPSHSSELVTQFLMGHPVRILQENGGWYRVRGLDNYPGWIEKAAVEVMDTKAVQVWNAADKAMVLNETLLKDSDGRVISDLTLGDVVMLGSRNGNQQEVILPDFRRGLVASEVVQSLQGWQKSDIKTLASQEVVSDAQQLLGRPYVWGGTSMRGLDCSGFTKTVFLQNGWLLARDASQQIRGGITVTENIEEIDRIQAGDLLFFGRKATADRKERIVHVGISLGNGKMIHCAGSVNIESLIEGEQGYNDYRAKTFVRAQRILGLEGEQGFNWLTEAAFEL